MIEAFIIFGLLIALSTYLALHPRCKLCGGSLEDRGYRYLICSRCGAKE
jgi:tRNA(Ile2) C34 agmatinyltransferase TiaS